MDDIAKAAGISKRTLYENFASKDDLLISCLHRMDECRMEIFDSIILSSDNFIDVIVKFAYNALDVLKRVNSEFLNDIVRFNMRNALQTYSESTEKFRHRFVYLIDKGKECGYIRKDVDSCFFSYMLLQHDANSFSIMKSRNLWSSEVVILTFLELLLRGMATPAALPLLDQRFAELRQHIDENNK